MNTTKGTSISLFILAVLFMVTLACGSSTSTTTPEVNAINTNTTSPEISTPLSVLTAETSSPAIATLISPTETTVPSTATTNANIIEPGTYLVGTDIKAGIYKGDADGDTCYWSRLKDVSGSLNSIIANDNSVGSFYVEVKSSDYAFNTACEMTLLPQLPSAVSSFPQTIEPGIYLVGIDIQPSNYKGKAASGDYCYWARLSNVTGELSAIIANDNAQGQFYVRVGKSDFALSTACELSLVGN